MFDKKHRFGSKLTNGDFMKSSLARLAADVSIMVDDSSMMMLPSGPTLTCGTGIASSSTLSSLLAVLALSSGEISFIMSWAKSNEQGIGKFYKNFLYLTGYPRGMKLWRQAVINNPAFTFFFFTKNESEIFLSAPFKFHSLSFSVQVENGRDYWSRMTISFEYHWSKKSCLSII